MKKEKKIKIKTSQRVKPEDIVQDSNPILREVSQVVEFPLNKENKLIMHKMIDFVRRSQNPLDDEDEKLPSAYGISAIQLGFKKKMFYIRIEDMDGENWEEFALINPELIEKSEQKSFLANGEACLSVKEKHKGYVYRNHKIVLRAIDFFTDREVEIEAKGLAAIVLQHEYDHLLGILFYDRINVLDPYFKIKNSIKIK